MSLVLQVFVLNQRIEDDFMAIHPIVVNIFQSGGGPTDRPTCLSLEPLVFHGYKPPYIIIQYDTTR